MDSIEKQFIQSAKSHYEFFTVNIEEGVSNHLANEQEQPQPVYDPDLRTYRYPRTQITESSSHQARDNVPTDRPDPNRIYTGRRRKREDRIDEELRSLTECKATRCQVMNCNVGPLKENQTVYIGLRARVNVRTLRNVFVIFCLRRICFLQNLFQMTESQSVTISSMMIARIADIPNRELKRYEIFTNVTAPQTEVKPGVVPLWVIVLSAVAGALILLLLIFLLYKVFSTIAQLCKNCNVFLYCSSVVSSSETGRPARRRSVSL